ncbi:MAG: SulP family inorganic anion transporter [Bryobacteraceae bacterium]
MSETISLAPSKDNLLKHDGPAGLVVFLVALPLCLGIALASGAPLLSGILSGVIGGLVVSWLSGSPVAVSGPAPGLAVTAAAIIQQLGFEAFLAAVVLAGVLQILFGVFRLGSIGNYVPNPVLRGMLAAIGLVMILKQIPHALGRDDDYDGDLSFLEARGSNTFTDIAVGILDPHMGAVLLSAICLLLLVFWTRSANKGVRWMQLIPGPLVVVLFGIAWNQVYRVAVPTLLINNPAHLVNLPTLNSLAGYLGAFRFPNFAALTTGAVWMAAVTLSVIASLESLLTIEAADKLDPFRRISPLRRELIAQGIGNILCGLIGAIPLTAVVVRTTANIYAGARTRMSSFVHGWYLLGATLLIPGFLNLVPLACLAVVLISVAYQLTKPEIYLGEYRKGLDQFVPFVVTVAAVLFTDLMQGVLVGLVCGLFFVIRANHRTAITVANIDNNYLLRLNKDASFVNKSEFRSKLRHIPEGSNVIIDGTKALFIDHDIYEAAEDFKKLAQHKGITVEFKNF